MICLESTHKYLHSIKESGFARHTGDAICILQEDVHNEITGYFVS